MPDTTIPVVQASRPQAQRRQERARRTEIARILLVEDEPVTAEVYARALDNDGHTVHVVRDGIQALHALRDRDHDLVVLDLGLPTMPGTEVLRRLRSDLRRGMPVIVISGTSPKSVPDAAALLAPGRWLEKPLRPRELVAAVREMRSN